MARLLLKVLIVGLPLWVLHAVYLVCDPFRVLWHHEVFYDPTSRVMINRDYVSTERLLATLDRRYDGYIFGNSRSLAFLTHEFEAASGARRAFHYDASDESLYGILGKLRLLDELGADPRQVLIVLDGDVLLRVTDSNDHLFIKHPLVSNRGEAGFQWSFYKAFFANQFYLKYLDRLVSGANRPYMDDVMDTRVMDPDLETNDHLFASLEGELAKDGEDAFYARRREMFDARDKKPIPRIAPIIGPVQLAMLTEARDILARHGARWRVVSSPRYDQIRLPDADLVALQRVFTKEAVFDYAGKNDITDDRRNYYETFHYRPAVGRRILREIY